MRYVSAAGVYGARQQTGGGGQPGVHDVQQRGRRQDGEVRRGTD